MDCNGPNLRFECYECDNSKNYYENGLGGCTKSTCGDGILDDKEVDLLLCDDGNNLNYDGCN